MKEKYKKFLEERKFLPLSKSNWNSFSLIHRKNESNKKEDFEIINKNVCKKSGIYIYEKDKQIFYVGKGRSLANRMKNHYKGSYQELPGDNKNKIWHRFWSSNRGKFKVYWKELEDIEQMLTCVLEPKFVSWKKERKLYEERT